MLPPKHSSPSLECSFTVAHPFQGYITLPVRWYRPSILSQLATAAQTQETQPHRTGNFHHRQLANPTTRTALVSRAPTTPPRCASDANSSVNIRNSSAHCLVSDILTDRSERYRPRPVCLDREFHFNPYRLFAAIEVRVRGRGLLPRSLDGGARLLLA
ncbi:hypothetical protein P171DRAFT_91300 [Karstenula rhodostoma CBS 690.94]|uniref:Uncharacterized protein n=1 Tax=Karstenula rhodostoma CBS 690.94 TaxID=1392251 RepID=A0A9P4PBU6_9PLEO|nr:hypothetical protein P171DRAFT_91300 [Karstenula rhodostoma CBS 690.94]